MLKNMLTFAVKKGLIDQNPLLGFGKLPVDEVPLRILTLGLGSGLSRSQTLPGHHVAPARGRCSHCPTLPWALTDRDHDELHFVEDYAEKAVRAAQDSERKQWEKLSQRGRQMGDTQDAESRW